MPKMDLRLQGYLDGVSRSFALAIPRLEENKRNEVAIGYLLCRIADTIEDSQTDYEEKKLMFNVFKESLLSDCKVGFDGLESMLSNGTKSLFEASNYEYIICAFKQQDDETKDLQLSLLDEMTRGMLDFERNKEVKDGISFYCKDDQDLKRYCGYVAGTVGVFLTKLANNKDGLSLDAEKAKSFGELLQLTNIIRDVREDYLNNKIYWPISTLGEYSAKDFFRDYNLYDKKLQETRIKSINELIALAAESIPETFEYISSIPPKFDGYISLCTISSVTALKTLEKMKDSLNPIVCKEPVKISKQDMKLILFRAANSLYTASQLEEFGRSMQRQLTHKSGNNRHGGLYFLNK